MYVFFEINHYGKLNVQKVDINDKIKTAIPNIDLLVKEVFLKLMMLFQLTKGQPVKIALEMPLLITNED